MGMFDNITVKKKLPLTKELKSLNINWKEHQFQTKDLENCLSDYFISKEGYLFEKVVEREYIPYTEEERKKQTGFSMWKEVIEKNQYNKKVDFHGKITLYDTFELSEEEQIWVDFVAYFIYGKLDKIELLTTKKYKSNKFSFQDFMEKRKEAENKISYRLKKSFGVFIVCKHLQKICYQLSSTFARLQTFFIRLQ
jgi:hypothetical protein